MANDRVFIKCKFCEGWKLLLKYFPQTGAKTRDNGVLEWLDAHADCRPHECEGDLRGDPGFTLHTESDTTLSVNKMGYIPPQRVGDTLKDFPFTEWRIEKL